MFCVVVTFVVFITAAGIQFVVWLFKRKNVQHRKTKTRNAFRQ